MFSGIQESHAPPMTLDQCMGFVGLVFDQDGDGAISRGEFYYMVEFIVACNYIESLNKGHSSKVTPEMRAKLPPELVDLMTSPEFAERCIANFESLDTDGSGKLEADELNEGADGASRDDLAPAIVSLLGGLDGTLTGPPISIEQCLGFAALFDQVTAQPRVLLGGSTPAMPVTRLTTLVAPAPKTLSCRKWWSHVFDLPPSLEPHP